MSHTPGQGRCTEQNGRLERPILLANAETGQGLVGQPRASMSGTREEAIGRILLSEPG